MCPRAGRTVLGPGHWIAIWILDTGLWEHGLRAFLWTPSTPNSTSGSAVELGALPKDWYPLVLSESEAYGINGRGAVVGTSNGRAFVYRNGRMDDLND